MIHAEVQRLRSLLRNQGPRVCRRLTELTNALHQVSERSAEDAARIGHGLATDFSELEVIAAMLALPEEVDAALATVKCPAVVREALLTVVAQVAASPTLRSALLKTFPHVCPPPPLRIDRFIALEHPGLNQYAAAARQLRQYIEEPGVVRVVTIPGIERFLLLLALLRQCRDDEYPPRGTALVNLTGVRSADEIADRVSLVCPGVGPETTLRGIGWHIGRQDRLVILTSVDDGLMDEGVRTAWASLVEGCLRGGRGRILVVSNVPLPIVMGEAEIFLPPSTNAEADGKALFGQLMAALPDAVLELLGVRETQTLIRSPQALFVFGMIWPFLMNVTSGNFSFGLPPEVRTHLAFLGVLAAWFVERPKLAQALLQEAEFLAGHPNPGLMFISAMLALSEGAQEAAQKLSLSQQQPESIKRYLGLVSARGSTPRPSLRPEPNPHLAILLAFGLGHQSMGQDEHADAAGHFTHAVERCRSLGNYHGMMEALQSQGTAMLAVGDLEEATASLEQALLIAREFDLSWKECLICFDLAMVAFQRGDWRRHCDLLNEALATARGLEEAGRVGILLVMLAAFAQHFGRPRESLQLAREASTLFQQRGQSDDAAMATVLAVDAALMMEHFQEADAMLALLAPQDRIQDESIRRARDWQQVDLAQITHQVAKADSLLADSPSLPPRLRARVAVQRGDREEARSFLEAVLDTPADAFSTPIDKLNTWAEALISLSFLEQEPARGVELGQKALILIEEYGNDVLAARAWAGIGRAFALQQKFTAARQAFSKAAVAYKRIGNESLECRMHLYLAQIAREIGPKKRMVAEVNKARKLARKLTFLGLPGNTLTEIADLFSELVCRREARELYSCALNTYSSTDDFLEQILLHIALVRQSGESAKEEHRIKEHLRQVILLGHRLAAQSRAKGQHRGVALGLLWASRAHVAFSEAQQALPMLVEAYRQASEVADTVLEADILEAMANALRSSERPEPAEMLQASAQILRAQGKDTDQIPSEGSELLAQLEALLSALASAPSSASTPPVEAQIESDVQ